MWSQFFSILTVAILLIVIYRKFPPKIRDIKVTSFSALIAWGTGDLFTSINIPYNDTIGVLIQSLSLSLLLVVFLIFIRRRKPQIFRYPYFIVFIPMLLPVAQYIVMDTEIMREVILMSLHGVSILVFTILSIGYVNHLNNKLITILGILLLLWGFSFYWILQNYYIVYSWAWGLTNSLGMVACVYSFADVLQISEN